MLKSVQQEQGNEVEVESFLQMAKEEYRANLKMEILSELVNLPAPQLTLKDLKGNSVRLNDYKGKIVILDFWATWCSWCIKSFPAMQQAIDKYAHDENIVFLFIDIGEDYNRVEGKIRKIMESNNYSFHILLDPKDAADNGFNIPGLPTKIVIGPDGNIRFRNIGFNNDSQLLEEIDLLVEVLQ